MTQRELDREVANATGETVSEIRHLGFSIADPDEVTFDPEAGRPQKPSEQSLCWLSRRRPHVRK